MIGMSDSDAMMRMMMRGASRGGGRMAGRGGVQMAGGGMPSGSGIPMPTDVPRKGTMPGRRHRHAGRGMRKGRK
jgi:hypothetical protein